ncbi:MAG: hypothetical protein AAGM38_05270 [Pseudomonadota bacterium]
MPDASYGGHDYEGRDRDDAHFAEGGDGAAARCARGSMRFSERPPERSDLITPLAAPQQSWDETYDREPRRLWRSLRLGLPLAGLALVLGVFVFTERGVSNSSATALMDGVALQSGLEVTNARYWGEADDGSPFRVSAERARPDGPNPSLIELDGVRGQVDMPDGRILKAEAADGVFKPKANTLALGGGVAAVSSDGYRLMSQALSFDLRARSGESASSVRIDGPLGELTAASMTARFEEGIVLRFDGDVNVVIRELVEPEDGAGAAGSN